MIMRYVLWCDNPFDNDNPFDVDNPFDDNPFDDNPFDDNPFDVIIPLMLHSTSFDVIILLIWYL